MRQRITIELGENQLIRCVSFMVSARMLVEHCLAGEVVFSLY